MYSIYTGGCLTVIIDGNNVKVLTSRLCGGRLKSPDMIFKCSILYSTINYEYFKIKNVFIKPCADYTSRHNFEL